MKKILFVCMGNICRSPAAEGVFRRMVDEAGLSAQFDIDSAGTIAYHAGEGPDRRMRSAALARGYPLEGRSRRIERRDFDDFDLVVAMDEENYRDLVSAGQGRSARVVRMCDYCTRSDATEVPDPWYGGPAGFETVLDILEDACANLLEQLSGR